MPEAHKNEKRAAVELLRLISLFVDYLDRNAFLNTVTLMGLMIVFGLANIAFIEEIPSLGILVGITYGGMVVSFAAYLYRKKMKKRFKGYLEAASQSTLVKSSEYEEIVMRMQDKFERQYIETLSETEDKISEMNTKIMEMQKERTRLEQQIKELKKEADRRF